MDFKFSEGDVTYGLALEWRQVEQNVTVNVGNKEAKIVPPGGGTTKTYYLNPTFINKGTKQVDFKFPSENGQTINLTPFGRATLSTVGTGSTKPPNMVITFNEGSAPAVNTYTISLPWSEKETDINVEVGTGQAVIIDDSSPTTQAPPTLSLIHI